MAVESNPQLVLCNGARLTSRKQAWKRAEPLELTSGKDGSVRIKLHEIVNQLTTNISARAADLLELATFVYVADQAVKRAGKKEVNYGDKWYRDFRLEVAVREPDFWNQRDVREALIETLDFLTGDSFEFSFSKNRSPTPVPTYLDFAAANPNPEGVQRVLLFSGGLDSLAGAVEEMCQHKCRVALVSHKPVSHLASRQTGLVQELQKRATANRVGCIALLGVLSDRWRKNLSAAFFLFLSCILQNAINVKIHCPCEDLLDPSGLLDDLIRRFFFVDLGHGDQSPSNPSGVQRIGIS